MPTLISDQRFLHAFHPYQSMSHTSSNSLPHRVHQVSPMTKAMVSSSMKTARKESSQPRRTVVKHRRDTSLDHSTCPAAIPNSPPTTRNEPLAASAVAPSLPLNLWNTLKCAVSHSVAVAIPPITCLGDSSSFHCSTNGSLSVLQHVIIPTHTSTGVQGFVQHSPPTRSTRRPVSPTSKDIQDHQDIVSYLKAWCPPVEYYARRRYQHPSLSYPSRRPSLPSLLEEHITHDGKMDVVCPQSAMSTSLRAYRRRIFPEDSSYAQPVSQRVSAQGWSDESEDDLESDESDDDEDEESDDDSEAVTPTTSTAPSPSYFLQPLFLTKLPGYP